LLGLRFNCFVVLLLIKPLLLIKKIALLWFY